MARRILSPGGYGLIANALRRAFFGISGVLHSAKRRLIIVEESRIPLNRSLSQAHMEISRILAGNRHDCLFSFLLNLSDSEVPRL